MRVLPILAIAACCALQPACTPEQRAPVRTALEASQCINGLVLRHLDAGDDLTKPETIATLAAEIASECNPLMETR
jgi:hypothetical protein